MILKITLMFLKAVISGTCLVLFKVFLIAFTYDFEQVKRVRNESGVDELKFHHKQFMIIFGRI